MKKAGIIAAIVIGVLLVAGLVGYGVFKARYREMVETTEEAYRQIGAIETDSLADGTYRGSFGAWLAAVELEVVVEDHHIDTIRILDQKSGKGYEARETVDRIIAAQSPKVDAVTGATGSSKCIMIATWRALESGEVGMKNEE
jgi:uncharacterized protein with FMN-binding domain